MNDYQVLRPLTPTEYSSLKDSIREYGVVDPIITDERGKIINGHHRQRIYYELLSEGTTLPPLVKTAKPGLTEEQKIQLAYELNATGRQLSADELVEVRGRAGRRRAAEQSLKQSPQMADNWHAQQLGVSKNTVATIREELEAACQIDRLDKFMGTDGKERPRQIERTIINYSQLESTCQFDKLNSPTKLVSEFPKLENHMPTTPTCQIDKLNNQRVISVDPDEQFFFVQDNGDEETKELLRTCEIDLAEAYERTKKYMAAPPPAMHYSVPLNYPPPASNSLPATPPQNPLGDIAPRIGFQPPPPAITPPQNAEWDVAQNLIAKLDNAFLQLYCIDNLKNISFEEIGDIADAINNPVVFSEDRLYRLNAALEILQKFRDDFKLQMIREDDAT